MNQNELTTMAGSEGYKVLIDELEDGKQRFRLRRDPGEDKDAGAAHTVGELRAWLSGFKAAMERHVHRL